MLLHNLLPQFYRGVDRPAKTICDSLAPPTLYREAVTQTQPRVANRTLGTNSTFAMWSQAFVAILGFCASRRCGIAI